MEEVFDSHLRGLGDLIGDLTKRDHLSTDPFERERMRCRPRFMRHRKPQAFKIGALQGKK